MNRTTQPTNATELAYLATATPNAPTMAQRLDALAFVHAKGQTLPDDTKDAQAIAAWASRDKLSAAALRPKVAARAVPKVAPRLHGARPKLLPARS